MYSSGVNDALATCHLLTTTACMAERTIGAALKPLGLTYCQARILCRLSEKNATMTELAELLCCNKSNVTQVTQALTKKSLLTKHATEKDKRLLTLRLTSEGKRAVRTIDAALQSAASQCFSAFTDAEKKQLSLLLSACKESCAS